MFGMTHPVRTFSFPSMPDDRSPGSYHAQDGSRLVIVSNRVVCNDDLQSGGLAMTLRSVLRKHGGLWFGWSGTVRKPPAMALEHDRRNGFDSAAVDLDPQDHDDFYHGFPARALHPLLQSRLHDMEFNRDDMTAWFRVNTHLAARLKTQLRPDDLIWINGIHLLPMARELRALGVDNRIGLFLHAALPPCNVLASLPDHDQAFSGLAAYDVVGVQTTRDLNALRDYLINFQSATRDHDDNNLRLGTRTLQLSALPVGIDVDRMARLAQRADARALFRKFRSSLGSHKLLIGIDRPDHAKGLCQRLRALDCLLQQSPQLAGTFSMLQFSPPVRYDMPQRAELDDELDRHVSHLNGHHARPDWSPVRYLKKGFRQQVLAGYLRAADVGLMTPLYDGMNLLAKEYVACQNPSNPGALVLSRFAGAARELTDAVQVNPLDSEDMAAGIRTAMFMPLDERRTRWEAMMDTLRHKDLQRWSNDFLRALAGLPAARDTA